MPQAAPVRRSACAARPASGRGAAVMMHRLGPACCARHSAASESESPPSSRALASTARLTQTGRPVGAAAARAARSSASVDIRLEQQQVGAGLGQRRRELGVLGAGGRFVGRQVGPEDVLERRDHSGDRHVGAPGLASGLARNLDGASDQPRRQRLQTGRADAAHVLMAAEDVEVGPVVEPEGVGADQVSPGGR